MNPPFLSVVTRYCGRIKLLARNRKSLATQTDSDFEHIIISDIQRKGLHAANKSLNTNKHRVKGQYVFILDDDDYVSDRSFIKHLKNAAKQHKVDILLFKMYRKPFSQTLPSKRVWGKQPILGEIGSCCFAVRSAIWKRHIHEFGRVRHGDYYFIKTLFDKGYSCYWIDRTMIMVDKVSSKDNPYAKVKVSPTVKKVYSQVTVVSINYCTKALTYEARRTMMLYYPKIPIILIDNGSKDESTAFVKAVGEIHSNIISILNDKNTGHGPAMNQGIRLAKTPYVFLYDSDASLRRAGLLEAMLAEFEKNPKKLYALGWLRKVDKWSGVPMKAKGMPYVHPHAAMLDRGKFLQLEPMESSGAPCTANARSALARNFELRDFPVQKYVRHLIAGTRRMFHGHWKPGATIKAKTWRVDEHYPI